MSPASAAPFPPSRASAPPFPRPIHILILEDRPADAEIIVDELRTAGFFPKWERVDTEAAFNAHLHNDIDLVLADYRLPHFDGLSALRCIQERKLDIPFILVSGVLSDEVAARCIKNGVTDYLRKDHLDRLGLAVTHALDERRLRGERRAMEEQLRQAQKMEVIGQLAGGIAHDFNNVLCVINGRASMLMDSPALPPAARDSIKEIYKAGSRAAALTRQLLVFSRKQAMHRVPVDLNRTVEDVAKMLGRLIGENVQLVLDLAADLPPVEADISMMEQVLINLAVNARDAMPHGGKLTISTSHVELSADDVRGNPRARTGTFVSLDVTDTGSGIPTDVMPHLFEPFFTTKPAGKGTGLGLSTVFGIVGQHQGWIDVVSEVDVGTRFSIHLPAAVHAEPKALLLDSTAGAVPGGIETILVVEDEASVREFTVAALETFGYRVLQAANGHDALEVWQRHSSRIKVVLTDMVLSDDVSGAQLEATFRALDPSVRVIITSGYTPEAMAEVLGRNTGMRFLHKPFQPLALAKAVRDALDSRSS